jgi:transcription initiation factor IIE alpha subunit
MRVIKKRTSRCPSCGEKISVGDQPKIGQYLLCSICDEKVEIVNLDPIILDLFYVADDNEYRFDEYWERHWETF